MISRKRFVGTLGAGALAAAPAGARAAETDPRYDGSLVLSGGGARGAYEAGAIAAFVEKSGVHDGQPLPGIDVVVGASIGALNGWFVATGQYSALASVWKTIASQNILRPKSKYAAVTNDSSGVLTRIYEAVMLEQGLVTSVRGLLSDHPVREWIHGRIDPSLPLLMPYVLTVTNLTRQQREVFYRSPVEITSSQRASITESVGFLNGTALVGREMKTSEIREAILATSSIPVLFDPVKFSNAEGGFDEYVDGGVANSAPFDLARALAKRVNVILLDPEQPPKEPTDNALEIGLVSFGIAQRRVRLAALRDAYLESQGKRLFTSRLTPAEQAYVDRIPAVDLFTITPATDLPAGVPDFNRQDLIDKTYAVGYQDGLAGWKPFKLKV
jgi:predicted acylesterase/phospholipase RssA